MTAEPRQEDDDRATFYWRLRSVSAGFPVTRLLVAINCLVFLAMVLIGGADFSSPGAEVVVRWGSNFGPFTIGGQWWRLFTCMFLHFGILHLAVNMWSLYQTGELVEGLFGRLHFLVLYVAAGLAGSLASLLWNPQVNSAGASGAVFGVIGGLLAFMIDPRHGVPRSVMRDVRRNILLVVVLNLGFGFSQRGIDNAAHLGGLAGGVLAGLMLARPLDRDWRQRHPYAGIAVTVLAGASLLVGGAAILSLRQGAAQASLPATAAGRTAGATGA